MISWHRVGQKVTPIEGLGLWFPTNADADQYRVPVYGEIYTISNVEPKSGLILLSFAEIGELGGNNFGYDARCFRPIYPDIIDQLRNFNAPVPSEPDTEPVRVKEGV